MIQLCHQIIHYDLGRTYYKITINEKIKTIDNKIFLRLMNDSKYSFSDCRNIRNFYDLSGMTKYNKFSTFYYRLFEFIKIVPQTKKKNNQKKKKSV